MFIKLYQYYRYTLCKLFVYSTLFVFFAFVLPACKKNNTGSSSQLTGNLTLISSGYASGAATRVDIYAQGNLYTGYNTLYFALYDSLSGACIKSANIALSASCQATAGLSTPSVPVENPVDAAGSDGLFKGSVTFTTPTSPTASWLLNLNVQSISAGKTGIFNSMVTVAQSSLPKAYAMSAPNGDNLLVSMVQPQDPKLGVNDFEISVCRQTGTLAYVQDSSFTIGINPGMPSMTGMGSPYNMNPVPAGNGHYKGKVDFIMSGAWRIYVAMYQGTACDSSHYFDLNLQP